MRSTALFFAAASAMSGVAYAGLAGLTFNNPLTAASREDRFDIVTINPTTGQATTTQKQLYALYDGAIDFTNTVVGPNQWALSLQAFDQAQVLGQVGTYPLAGAQTTNPINPASSWGYLARQDLRAGGRFEYCQLSSSNQPINIFWDTDSSVIATAVTPGSASFNIVKISFSQSSTFCVYSQVAVLPAIASVSANVKAQRGNRIYFVTEPASTFSQLAAVTIRSYDITSAGATAVHATTLSTGIFPTAIAPTSDNVIIFQGWNSALSTTSTGFVTYEINLATFASATTLTSRGITSATEEISFASTFVNQTNSLYTLKNVATTITTTSTVSTVTSTNPAILFSQPWLTATSFAAASTSETKATTALNTFNVFNVFDLANATIAALDTDASTTTNTLVLTGAFAYAGVITGTGAISRVSVSTCKITFTNTGATAATTYETVANGAGNSASCSLSTIPTAATAVQVQFAADGVNYGPASSFTYNGAVSTGRFGRSTYNLRDGTPVEAAGEKVTVELLDSNGRKILFPATSTTVTLTAAPTGAAIVRSITGNVADARNGRAIFPNLAIDVDYPSANNNGDIAILTLSASYSASTNTVVATTTVNVKLIRSTRGTLAALAFPTVASTTTQVFETHLINPSAALTSAALKIGTRTLSDTTTTSANNLAPALALGLVAYDRDNKVLNTVETRATDSNNLNTLVLNGAALSGSGTRGVGVCILPRSTNSNDGPSSIWYESTDATSLATTFLAIVFNTDLTTGSGARLVRYTRLAGSTIAQTCVSQQVDLLPIFDHGYGNHQVLPLTEGRIAFVENDAFFTATGNNAISNTAYGGSILSVFRYSTVAATAGATATVAGSWTIRNKVLPMNTVASVTQSATNELAIAGNVWGAVNSNGIYLVDISTEATANTAATAATASLFTTSSINNDFAVFLAAGTADTFADNRNRYQGSSTAYTTTSQSYIESIQLARGLTVPAAARSVETTGRNYIDFFNIDDVVITALSPNSIAKGSAQAITVTANNVINSSQLKCRFSAGTLNAVEYVVSAALTTVTLAADGTTVNCGAVPTNFAALDGYTYIQVSNDGGNNYGPEGKLAVGTAAPVVSNVAVPTASNAISSNTVYYEVYGDFVDNAANRAALSTFFGVTLLNQLNALNLGTWFLSQAFTVGTTTTTSGRSNYNVVYQTIATSSRLAVLQSSSAQLNALLGLISSSSNQAVLTGAGATTNARVYNGTNTSTSSSSTLSQGAIAGIVIGCVVGGLLIIAGIAYLLFKSSQNKKAATFSQSRTYDARGGSSSSGSSSSSSSSDDGSYSDYSSDDYSDYV